MMNFTIKHQDTYSRGELLLRSFFGAFYLIAPHLFLLVFLSIASIFIGFIAFWVILFTGKYPKEMYDFQVKFIRWNLRVNARILNLSDGYPAFGLNAKDENVTFEMEYPKSLSRGNLLLKTFLGIFYIIIPHLFVLSFRIIGVYFVIIIAWWAVLFTGKYPKGMFDFMVGTLRWELRFNLYIHNMTDTYPPFTGRVLENENQPV